MPNKYIIIGTISLSSNGIFSSFGINILLFYVVPYILGILTTKYLLEPFFKKNQIKIYTMLSKILKSCKFTKLANDIDIRLQNITEWLLSRRP